MKKNLLLALSAYLVFGIMACSAPAPDDATNADAPSDSAATVTTDTTQTSSASTLYEPVKWTFETKTVGKNEFEVRYSCNINDGWKVYWQSFCKENEGPYPVAFELELNDNIEAINKPTPAEDASRYADPIFGCDVAVFKKKAIITQKFRVKDPAGNTTLKGGLEFMTCDDQRCLPPKFEEFQLALK